MAPAQYSDRVTKCDGCNEEKKDAIETERVPNFGILQLWSPQVKQLHLVDSLNHYSCFDSDHVKSVCVYVCVCIYVCDQRRMIIRLCTVKQTCQISFSMIHFQIFYLSDFLKLNGSWGVNS